MFILNFPLKMSFLLCVDMNVHVEIKRTLVGLFLLSYTMEVQRIELRSSGLAVNALSTEP